MKKHRWRVELSRKGGQEKNSVRVCGYLVIFALAGDHSNPSSDMSSDGARTARLLALLAANSYAIVKIVDHIRDVAKDHTTPWMTFCILSLPMVGAAATYLALCGEAKSPFARAAEQISLFIVTVMFAAVLWFVAMQLGLVNSPQPHILQSVNLRADMTIADDATVAIAVIAAITALVTAWAGINARNAQREATAKDVYRDYLKLAFENPDLAIPGKVVDENDPGNDRYRWFVAFMLNSCDEIARTKSNDKGWRKTLRLDLKPHQAYLKSPQFVEDGGWDLFSKQLRDVADEALD